MTRFFRSTAAAITLALMLAGTVHALPLEQRSAQPGLGAMIERIQGWLASLGSPQMLSSAWEEEGIIMDPDGRDSVPPAPPEGPGADAGIIMDPNG